MKFPLHVTFLLIAGLFLAASGACSAMQHWPNIHLDDAICIAFGFLLLLGAPNIAKTRQKSDLLLFNYIEKNVDAKRENIRRQKLKRVALILYAIMFFLVFPGALAVNHGLSIGYWLGGAALLSGMTATALSICSTFIMERLRSQSSKFS